MTMLTDVRSHQLPRRQDAGATIASSAASHAPMIVRFGKLALAVVLIAVLTVAVIGTRVAIWFPHFSQ